MTPEGWRKFFRSSARLHIRNIRNIRNIRWRKAQGLPFDKRAEDLRFCLQNRHTTE